MNPKINKLKAEREKNSKKIAALQQRNREIDDSIHELENLDIVGMVTLAMLPRFASRRWSC